MIKYGYIALFALLFTGFSSSFTTPTETVEASNDEKLTWFVDFSKANIESEKTGKPIFAFFTGSDWCGWCTRLQRNVFAKDSFVKWANKEVILLELDFPKRKALPANLKKQNYELAKLLNVRGYPTIWIFNTVKNKETKQVNINLWGSCGYPRGATAGKEEVKFLADVQKIFDTQKK